MSQRFPGKRLTLLFNKVKSPTRRLPPSAFIPLSNFPCCIWYCWCFSFFLSEKWIVVVSCSKRGSGLSPSCCLSYLLHRSWSGLSRYQASACSWAVGADKNGEGVELWHVWCPSFSYSVPSEFQEKAGSSLPTLLLLRPDRDSWGWRLLGFFCFFFKGKMLVRDGWGVGLSVWGL